MDKAVHVNAVMQAFTAQVLHEHLLEEVTNIMVGYSQGDYSEFIIGVIEGGDPDRATIMDSLRQMLQEEFNEEICAVTKEVGATYHIMQLVSTLVDYTALAERVAGEQVDKILNQWLVDHGL